MTIPAMSHKIMELDYAMSIIRDVAMSRVVVRYAPEVVIGLQRVLEDIDRVEDILRQAKLGPRK